MVGDEIMIKPVVFDELMQDGTIERRVAARADRQVQIGGAGDGSQAWIDDNKFGTQVARLP